MLHTQETCDHAKCQNMHDLIVCLHCQDILFDIGGDIDSFDDDDFHVVYFKMSMNKLFIEWQLRCERSWSVNGTIASVTPPQCVHTAQTSVNKQRQNIYIWNMLKTIYILPHALGVFIQARAERESRIQASRSFMLPWKLILKTERVVCMTNLEKEVFSMTIFDVWRCGYGR